MPVDIAVAGNEDDWEVAAEFLELVLQFEPGHVGHADVKENGAVAAEVARGEEAAGIGISDDVVGFSAQEKGPGAAHGVVVVDDADERLGGCVVEHGDAPNSGKGI